MTDKLTHLPHHPCDPHHPARIPAATGVEATTSVSNSNGYPGWSSTNWSGYAISNTTNGTYHSVSATWTVPKVQPSSPTPTPTSPGGPSSWWGRLWRWLLSLFGMGGQTPSGETAYSAAWIGIDGFNNSSLIQTGTAQNIVNGKPQYYAWWEILPNPETEIDSSQYPVSPGDQIVGHITEQSAGTWQITLGNRTKGWVFHKNGISYQGPQTSVEWVMEAPEVNGSIAPLANYRELIFSGILANGLNPDLQPFEAGVMMQNGKPVSTPSLPSASHNAFAVAYSATAPAPPNA